MGATRPFAAASALLAVCGVAWYARNGAGSVNLRGEGASALAAEYEAGCLQSTKGPVLAGYDVVAYFSLEAGADAIQGVEQYYSIYGNYTFYFSSADNRAAFAAEPTKYLPQYGGFCAWGISEESWWTKSTLGPSADPSVWEVIDDKLYFFMFDKPRDKFMGVYTDDDLDASGSTTNYIADGDARWEGWFGSRAAYNTDCFWWDASSDRRQ